MPNWIVGDLKIRGIKSNIEKFLIEALTPVDLFGHKEKSPIITKNEYGITIKDIKGNIYLKGTQRSFVDADCIVFDYPDNELETTVFVLEDYKTAWGIDVEGLVKLSQEFEVDFKILGFERGMEFNHDVEIVGGQIVKNEEINFDDYMWECIRPTVGG
jgi:hypothetical protein